MPGGIVPGALSWAAFVNKEAINDAVTVSCGSDGESIAEVEGFSYA